MGRRGENEITTTLKEKRMMKQQPIAERNDVDNRRPSERDDNMDG